MAQLDQLKRRLDSDSEHEEQEYSNQEHQNGHDHGADDKMRISQEIQQRQYEENPNQEGESNKYQDRPQKQYKPRRQQEDFDKFGGFDVGFRGKPYKKKYDDKRNFDNDKPRHQDDKYEPARGERKHYDNQNDQRPYRNRQSEGGQHVKQPSNEFPLQSSQQLHNKRKELRLLKNEPFLEPTPDPYGLGPVPPAVEQFTRGYSSTVPNFVGMVPLQPQMSLPMPPVMSMGMSMPPLGIPIQEDFTSYQIPYKNLQQHQPKERKKLNKKAGLFDAEQ